MTCKHPKEQAELAGHFMDQERGVYYTPAFLCSCGKIVIPEFVGFDSSLVDASPYIPNKYIILFPFEA